MKGTSADLVMLQEVFLRADADAIIAAAARGHLKYSQVQSTQHWQAMSLEQLPNAMALRSANHSVRAYSLVACMLELTLCTSFLQRFRGGVLGGELLTLSRYPIVMVSVTQTGCRACSRLSASANARWWFVDTPSMLC